MITRNIAYDTILLEADRVSRKRRKDLDLYYKTPQGDFEVLAEAYEPEVEEMVSRIFKRKKMRYLVSFVDAIELQDGLLPSSHKALRFMCKYMNYGNLVKNIGLRDIQESTGLNMKYVIKGIKQLCAEDIIRFSVEKGRRNYIVNPTYFYKGTLRSIFKCVRDYDRYPKRNDALEIEYEQNEEL
tara:strand:+ start:2111 stop:2662 length:552 start_codon:yes stop_codon:yes gene_type:complete